MELKTQEFEKVEVLTNVPKNILVLNRWTSDFGVIGVVNRENTEDNKIVDIKRAKELLVNPEMEIAVAGDVKFVRYNKAAIRERAVVTHDGRMFIFDAACEFSNTDKWIEISDFTPEFKRKVITAFRKMLKRYKAYS